MIPLMFLSAIDIGFFLKFHLEARKTKFKFATFNERQKRFLFMILKALLVCVFSENDHLVFFEFR